MNKIKIANLDTVEINNNSETCVVFLHGYGANWLDLVPLSQEIRTRSKLNWYFPNAPQKLDFIPNARAWFEVDFNALERAQQTQDYRPFKSRVPKGLHQAHNIIDEFIFELRPKYKTFIIGGFSQGAMLSTQWSLLTDNKPDAMILLSATLINQAQWLEHMPSCKGLQFFQSHGKQDPTLPFVVAQDLEREFQQNGLKGELNSFNGGHEIPMQIINKTGEFLNHIIS